jgi:hypothetical protein
MVSPPLVLFAVTLGLLSVVGWGWLAFRLLEWRSDGPVHGPSACLGLAVVLAACSVANLAHGLGPGLFWTLSAGGGVWFVVEAYRRARRGSFDIRRLAWFGSLWILGCLLALPVLLTVLNGAGFNVGDDNQAYLVAIRRVISLGSVEFDPFNYRYQVAGTGGMSSLQAPMVAMFGWPAVRAVDRGLGAVLLLATVLWLAERRSTPWIVTLALLVGLFALAEHDTPNITSYLTSMALLMGVFCLVSEPGNAPVRSGVAVGLMVAGLGALKYTALPTALLCVGFVYLFRYWRNWRGAVAPAAAFVAAAALPLIAWSAPSWGHHLVFQSLRYGTGQDEVNVRYMLWWLFTNPNVISNFGYMVSLLVSAALTALILRRSSLAAEAWQFLGAVVLGGAATTWLTGGVQFSRYNRPLAIAACLAVGALVGGSVRRGTLRSLAVAGLVLVGFVPLRNISAEWRYPRDYAAALKVLNRPLGPQPPDGLASAVQKLQERMAPGAAALIRIGDPYLLDFARNRLYVVDFPYAVSPAPGMAGFTDVPALRGYLRRCGIRYVAYAYGNEAYVYRLDVIERLKNPYLTPWQRALNRNFLPFNSRLLDLVKADKPLYDDGLYAVVDLDATARADEAADGSGVGR